ncbi:helix-turn-helix domain-containing protein [Curtobacterium sp. ISL-83]|uniref:helix-turn-helix domain-containing protein n=1 Tax=Curtobacterium sp. ISL-83 TaxID=2819145 RepID=UPI001BE77289|nr:helix-turn-helix domain-containing protein [Curtobacterium sp. ISL-83]MBT2504025.1 helix-turn-helix transcriptional regulator [Curtobacterium sp. ISL-83]
MADARAVQGGNGLRPISPGVQAAVRFLRDAGRSEVRVEDAAEAAGMTARGLQGAFRRELGTTPMAYHRRLRLEGVRRALEEAEPGTRVTIGEVARSWGFSNVGRMSAEYRQVYGTAPSTTLRFLQGRRTPEGDPVTDVDAPRTRRFRLVLDCEVDVEDPQALQASIDESTTTDSGAWRGYRPSGTTEDLLSYTLSSAVRRAVLGVDGVTLRAVNPMLRLPDVQGGYAPAELPAWSGSPPVEADDLLAVESGDPREGPDG